MRENVTVHFGQILERSSNIMEELDIDIKVTRIAGRQTMRANVPYSTAEEYYKRVLALPLLDAIQQQPKERFTKLSISASKLLGLDPKCMVTKTSDEMISSLASDVNLYAKDFSEDEKQILETQLLTYHSYLLRQEEVQDAIKTYVMKLVPLVRRLTQITLTL